MIRQSQSFDREWDLHVASHPWRKKRDQKSLFDVARDIGRVHADSSSIYDAMEDDAKVEMIGSAIKTGGARWVKNHPEQIQWLADHGFTIEGAVEYAERQLAKEMDHPFWSFSGADKQNDN